jgi:hypothetical protein
MNRGGLVVAENGTPSLEVSFCSDGHPPFTKREREIHLNGTSGVKFKTRIEKSVRVLFSTPNAQRPASNVSKQSRILVERRALSVERWAFLN